MSAFSTLRRVLFISLLLVGIVLSWCLWMPALLDIGNTKLESESLGSQAREMLHLFQHHKLFRSSCRGVGGVLLLLSLGLLISSVKRKWLKSSLACAVGLNCLLMPSLLKRVSFTGFEKVTVIKHHNLYQCCQRLQLIECQNPLTGQVFQETSKIKTFADFHQWVRSHYQKHYSEIHSAWSFQHEEEFKVAFITNLVSRLWGYGNAKAVDKPGCVISNEDRNWKKPDLGKINVQTYLSSKIGCCNDHAYLVKFLLDCENIPNRLTLIPGHIFNEAKINDQWWTLDATANILVPYSWETIHQSELPKERDVIRVYVFPHSNLKSVDSEQYRSRIGHFRLHQLMSIAIQRDKHRSIQHTEYAHYFRSALEKECGCPDKSD